MPTFQTIHAAMGLSDTEKSHTSMLSHLENTDADTDLPLLPSK